MVVKLSKLIYNDIKKSNKLTLRRKITMPKVEGYKKEIIKFWTTQWEYISMFDAIKEVNQSVYKGIFTIRELKGFYKQVKQYNY
jgi:hypothetical protein